MISNNSSNANFLLVDNIEKLDELGDYESKTIITFDYNSHIFLQAQKISHITSDKFHSSEELEYSDNLIYTFVEWYEIPSIKKIIFDNNINLGELFFSEFRTELVTFLKKFIEVSNLIKLNPDSNYFVSENLWELTSPLCKNTRKVNIKKSDIFIHNSIDVPIKVGSKQLTVTLSTKNASRIQKFLDKTTKNLLLNKKYPKKFSNILIVNFSTLKNEEFLLEMPNHNLNFIKYDRTTPAIWNIHTLNIIKNSKCIIENENTLLNKKCQEQIVQNKKSFLDKINLIISSKELETFFSLNQFSFWNQIKPLLTQLCEKHFSYAAKEIELCKKLFKKYKFSKILLMHESGMVEQIVLNLAKEKNIPVYVLQHGLPIDSIEMNSENNFQRYVPKNVDNCLVWGTFFKNHLESISIGSKKIISIGSIFHDKFYQNKISNYNSEKILLASDPFAFNRLFDLTINQKEIYHKTVEEVCKIVTKNNKKLMIKTHPQKNQYEKEIAKKIDKKILVNYSGDISSLIESSDLVIVTDATTVILEAMMMQKPVISIRMKDHYGKPEIFNYCKQISIDSLDSFIKSFYSSSKIKNELIRKGNDFLKLSFQNQGCASQELLKFLQYRD